MHIKSQAVLVMDFGGQYSQLIARRVREDVYKRQAYKGKKSREQTYRTVLQILKQKN